MEFLQQTLVILTQLLILLIILRAILSWFIQDKRVPIYHYLLDLTEPLLRPIRRLIPQRGIDLSPLIAILLLQVLQKLIYTYL